MINDLPPELISAALAVLETSTPLDIDEDTLSQPEALEDTDNQPAKELSGDQEQVVINPEYDIRSPYQRRFST